MLKFTFQKIIILSILLLSLITISGCNKKKTAYLSNPIAIVYKDNIPYIINSNNELFNLSKYDSIVPYFGDILIVKKTIILAILEILVKKLLNLFMMRPTLFLRIRLLLQLKTNST